VGFGAGQSRLIVTVRVIDCAASDTPAVELKVTGGSKGSARPDFATLADADDAAEQIVEYLMKRQS
jgi:hypothetical protein